MEIDRLMMELWSGIRELPWQWIVAGLRIALATLATVHAMLFKRDPRAALDGFRCACFFRWPVRSCITCSVSIEFRLKRAGWRNGAFSRCMWVTRGAP